MAEYSTLEDVCRGLELLHQQLKSREELEMERRKVDDERHLSSSKERQLVIDRVDAHGKRTTILETQIAAFFGDQGAFKIVVKGMEETTRKLNTIIWACLVGSIGLLAEIVIRLVQHK